MSEVQVPYLFSGDNWIGNSSAGVLDGFGQTPAPVIANWAGLLPAYSVFWTIYHYESPSNLVQAVWEDQGTGQWHYGGFSQYGVPAEPTNRIYYTFEDWGAIGLPPTTSPAAPSSGIIGFGSLYTSAGYPVNGWNEGGTAGSYAPPNVFVVANVAQGGAAGDFWLLGFGAADPPSGFAAWTRPPTLAGWGGGGGGPTIGASAYLSGGSMFVAGPVGVAIENAFGFIVGAQNPGGPLYIFSLLQNYPGGYDGSGDYGPWVYNTDAPALPGSGVTTYPVQLAANTSRGDLIPSGGSIEDCTVLWAYRPEAAGQFSAWYLDYGAASWTQLLPTVFDVVPCIGGFGVSADNSTLYLVGYSPSYGCNVALSFDVATATITLAAGTPPASSLMVDGYTVNHPGFTPYYGAAEGAFPTSQKGTIVDPIAAAWPYLIDQASAEYEYENLGATVAGTWLRYPTANIIFGTPLSPVSPLRMFQRSDAFGLRMVQAHGSANSPLSLRNYGSGNSHV